MLRRTAAVVTLTALVNLMISGCCKVVNMKLDEVAVDTPKRITGVVAKSGEDVTFDNECGKYDPAHKRITGVSTDGISINKSLKDLNSVRVVDPPKDSLSPLSITAREFHQYLRPKKTDEIRNAMTADGVTHNFWSGARFDRPNRLVEGLSRSGAALRIPFDSIAYIGVKKTDWVKTGIFIGVSAGLLTAAVFAAASAMIEGLNETAWLY